MQLQNFLYDPHYENIDNQTSVFYTEKRQYLKPIRLLIGLEYHKNQESKRKEL